MPATTKLPNLIVVHPLVLLSTVDHYNRVAKGTRKRVVGVLLGTTYRGKVEVTNSYAGKWGRKGGVGWVGVYVGCAIFLYFVVGVGLCF